MSLAKIVAQLVERGEEDLAEELLSVGSEMTVAMQSKIPWKVEWWWEERGVLKVVKKYGLKIVDPTFVIEKRGIYMSFTVTGGVITEDFFWEMREALGGSKTTNPGNWSSSMKDGKLGEGKQQEYSMFLKA